MIIMHIFHLIHPSHTHVCIYKYIPYSYSYYRPHYWQNLWPYLLILLWILLYFDMWVMEHIYSHDLLKVSIY